jgi:hypothetical protein
MLNSSVIRDGYESSVASQCERNGFRRIRGLPLHLFRDTQPLGTLPDETDLPRLIENYIRLPGLPAL